ncbi:MAG: hypothetical protein JNM63_13610, partial [Spirochaetia bacterium]|nr:hypothetical protein [Spirochaetia bacterium]
MNLKIIQYALLSLLFLANVLFAQGPTPQELAVLGFETADAWKGGAVRVEEPKQEGRYALLWKDQVNVKTIST